MVALRWIGLISPLVAGLIVFSCNDDSNINDCSRRNKPMRYEGGEWTCKDRDR